MILYDGAYYLIKIIMNRYQISYRKRAAHEGSLKEAAAS